MLSTTVEIIRTTLKADSTLAPLDRTRLLALLKNGAEPQPTKGQPAQSRIVRRKEAAQRLGRSLRSVDLLAQQGLLKKAKWDGRSRCAGITLESLEALLKSGE